MSHDKRVERNKLSAQSLQRLLSEIVHDPNSHISNELLQKALCSQSALSKYSDQDRNISSSSINTLKRISNSTLDGGFQLIDRLRIQAAQAIEKAKTRTTSHRKTSKLYLITKNKELQIENQTLKQNLLLLTDALHKSLVQGASYAKHSEKSEILDICLKEQKQLLLSLSLIKTPLEENVIRIYEK